MKKIIATVFLASSIDDYKNGEDGESYSTFKTAEESFANIADAISWFKETFECKDPQMKIDQNDDFITADYPPMKLVEGHFIKAEPEEIEKWAKGEKELWSIQYQLRLTKLAEVTANEISKAMASINS